MKKLRSLEKALSPNNGTRSLFESILVPEVDQALRDWIANAPTSAGVMIGGLALSFYVKPRTTQDVDLLFLSKETIPKAVFGFRRTRVSAFQHNTTHVEIEVLTPQKISLPENIAAKLIETAIEHNGIKVASAEGLVASKLNRLSYQDKADIVNLLLAKKVDLEKLKAFPLSQEKLAAFGVLLQEIS